MHPIIVQLLFPGNLPYAEHRGIRDTKMWIVYMDLSLVQKIKTLDEASNSVAGALVIGILNCGTMGIWGQMTVGRVLHTIGHAAVTLVSISWMPTARTYADAQNCLPTLPNVLWETKVASS